MLAGSHSSSLEAVLTAAPFLIASFTTSFELAAAAVGGFFLQWSRIWYLILYAEPECWPLISSTCCNSASRKHKSIQHMRAWWISAKEWQLKTRLMMTSFQSCPLFIFILADVVDLLATATAQIISKQVISFNREGMIMDISCGTSCDNAQGLQFLQGVQQHDLKLRLSRQAWSTDNIRRGASNGMSLSFLRYAAVACVSRRDFGVSLVAAASHESQEAWSQGQASEYFLWALPQLYPSQSGSLHNVSSSELWQ
jgi:hypothetical protein